MALMDVFQFKAVGVLRDADLALVLEHVFPWEASPWGVPAYRFQMRHAESDAVMGSISLRIGSVDRVVMYAGHIGYSVHAAHRGRHYAERATRLLLPLAAAHGMTELWITCSPDNLASRKTIERLGAEFVETVDVPPDYPLADGEIRKKRRYRLPLEAQYVRQASR
jgi:tagatose 1,6-diphosphate aldolase